MSVASPTYQVWILNGSMQRLAVLDEYTSLTWTRRWQQPNSFELHCSRYARGAEYLVEDNLLQVMRDGQVEFTSIIEHGELQLDEQGKASEVWIVRGGDIITRRICLPPSGLAYDERSGPAETVMKGYVTANVISPADTNRTISLVSNETDGARGASIAVKARYEALADKLEECARAGGIGWELVGTATGLQLKIVPGVDRSTAQSANPPIIFSPDFGNLKTLGYQWTMLNRVTLAYVAGQGEGSARQIATVYDGATVPSGTARREAFIDARDLDTTAKLTDRGRAKLSEQGPKTRLEAQILTVGPYRYRADWDLGDIVTVRNLDWGVLEHLRITEVRVTLEHDSGEQIEVAFGAAPANLLTVVGQAIDRADVAVRQDQAVPDGSITTAKLADGAATGAKLGSDVVRNTGSQSIDSPTLVVDATNHRVGIGTATPQAKLDVAGDITANNIPRGFLGSIAPGIFYTSSSTFVDVTGGQIGVTVGTRPIKLTLCAVLDSMTDNMRGWLQVYDVTASASVLVVTGVSAGGSGPSVAGIAIVTPSSGSRTYKLQARTESGTMRVLGAVLLVEEV